MSDLSDRGRRRKKRGIKIKEIPSPTAMGRPIILAKPSTSTERQTPTPDSLKLVTKTCDSAPTVILKSRDESCTPPQTTAVSSSSSATSSTATTILASRDVGNAPSLASPGIGSAGSAPSPQPQPVYQIQQKSGVSTSATTPTLEENRLAAPTEMKYSVKLVDENLQWCDNAVEFLQEQSDYFVIGVLGLQGVGKSTLMSFLSGNKPDDLSKNYTFKPQPRELRELGEHCTGGIDIFITPERMVILDVQPVLSASVMDHMMQYEKKYSTEYTSVESALEIQSLQIASFLMAVCHTILVVQDWFCDPSLLRFLHTAEMLKPSTPATVHDPVLGLEDQTEYYPHLVFVQTRCNREDFTPRQVQCMQDMYASIFQKSKLKFRGPAGICQSYLLPSLSCTTPNDNINLFLIPEKSSSEPQDLLSNCFPQYQGHPGYETLCDSLCRQVLALPRHALTPTAHSEKNWFHYAARTWELVKKSNLFMEYSRLLP